MLLSSLTLVLGVLGAVNETNYCGTTWLDANKRCHAPCEVDANCGTFKTEKCFSACTACPVDPTEPPSPPPAPTPALLPDILPGCPKEHPPEHAIQEQCAASLSKIWQQAGGSQKTCYLAVSVAIAESGGDAHVQGPNSDQWHSIDRGLWQLNSHWHPEVADKCAYDRVCNGKAALRISLGGTNFSSWTTVQQGINIKFLNMSEVACRGFKPTPPTPPAPTPPPPVPTPPPPTPPAGTKWACDTSTHTCKQGPTGFSTQHDCNLDCSSPVPSPTPPPPTPPSPTPPPPSPSPTPDKYTCNQQTHQCYVDPHGIHAPIGCKSICKHGFE